MTPEQITYLVFGVLLVVALVFDLGLLSKKSTQITMKKALGQTIFWVFLAMSFFIFMWVEDGRTIALEYLSAYLMEWSLSIDNIFVFILIFSFFRVKEEYVPRALLLGIMMAILFRIIFISIGIVLIEKFHWLLYVFGALLLYTGVKMFTARNDEEVNLSENKVYRFLQRIFPIVSNDGGGKLTIMQGGKRFYTNMFVVIIMLASTDIVFALDSIPAVFAISQNRMVVYTSNIFAVLGLRSLFFLLKGAINKFAHLQQGIAVVLVFIGIKMLVEYFKIHIPVFISLLVIVVCITASVVYSISIASRSDDDQLNSKGPDVH